MRGGIQSEEGEVGKLDQTYLASAFKALYCGGVYRYTLYLFQIKIYVLVHTLSFYKLSPNPVDKLQGSTSGGKSSEGVVLVQD